MTDIIIDERYGPRINVAVNGDLSTYPTGETVTPSASELSVLDAASIEYENAAHGDPTGRLIPIGTGTRIWIVVNGQLTILVPGEPFTPTDAVLAAMDEAGVPYELEYAEPTVGGGDLGYTAPAFIAVVGDGGGTVTEDPTNTWTLTNTSAALQNYRTDDVTDFLLKINFPGTAATLTFGVQQGDTSPSSALGFWEMSLFGEDPPATAISYGQVSFQDIDASGDVYILRVANSISIRTGGTSYADATPLVDAPLAAATSDAPRLWLVMEDVTGPATVTFLPLPA